MEAITQEDGVKGRRRGKKRSPGPCMHSKVKYTPDVQRDDRFFFFNLAGRNGIYNEAIFGA